MKKDISYRSVRLLVLTLLMMLCVNTINAVPAKPGQHRTLTLSDGTTVSASLVGDEHGHYWAGADGRAYQQISGSLLYRPVDKETISRKAMQRRAAVNQQRRARMSGRRNVGQTSGNITGEKKGLVILVNFPAADGESAVTMQSGHNQALFTNICNTTNYTEGNFKGSVHDYFLKQSEGKFVLTFDVVGPVTVSQPMSYYGGNNSNDEDQKPGDMIIEAVKLVDSQVNFTDYDWDNDGYVDQVYVIYAGKGEADGGASNTIWPHEWSLSSAKYYGSSSQGAQKLDDVTIDTYACGAELNGSGNICGVGTMCHEFSHCLGYPDFYDTRTDAEAPGMGYWDLMDSGSYNDDGYQPAGYTSYERWLAGWIEPTVLEYTEQVNNLPALQNEAKAYIIYNKGNRNEYFLLENRQKVGWDRSLPGKGLLILHVDYKESAWTDNEVNNVTSHQRMSWVAADNSYDYEIYYGSKYYTPEGMATDTYPYGSVNAFGKSTTPAAKLFNNNSDGTKYLDSSVEDITQNADGTVSFLFRGLSRVQTPVFTPAAGRYTEAQTVTISCETEGATIYYTVDGTDPTTSSTKYTSPITVSQTTTVKAVAAVGTDLSDVATARYIFSDVVSDPDTKTFQLVSSTDELVDGMRYIIACGSKKTAAGALSNTYLTKVDVTVEDDIVTIADDVAVFVLEQETNGWSLRNEADDKYLYASDAKKLAYSTTATHSVPWTLSNGTDGVILTYNECGTMLFNSGSPRFTTYTSNPTTSMIQANLYVEVSNVTPQEPVIVTEESLTFETAVGTSKTLPLEVLSEHLSADITLTLDDPNKVFSLSAATIDKSEEDATVEVTFTPTAAGDYQATLTLSSTGAESAVVILSGTATDATPIEGDVYALVTDASTLAAGDKILIAYVENNTPLVMSTTQNSNNRSATNDVTLNSDGTLTPGTEAQVITLEKDDNDFLFNVETGYLYASSNSANQLKTHATKENSSATVSISGNGNATIEFQGGYSHNSLRYNPNNGNPIFSCYAPSNETMALPQIYRKVTTTEPETIEVAIGATGYATLYYGDKNLVVPAGVEAYVYHLEGNELKEQPVGDVINAGTAVVLKATKTLPADGSVFEFEVTDTPVNQALQSDLYGYDEDTETSLDGNCLYYMLSLNAEDAPESIGFYYGADNGGAFTSLAHRAFLALPAEKAYGVKALLLNGELIIDTTTGLSTLQSDASSITMFNLNGQRVNAPKRPGIYVIGGRKVIIK